MARVYLSLGSNIERERNIRAGIKELHARFGALQLSSVYESEAVGFTGDHFFNLVAGFDTCKSVEAVAETLRAIEDHHGRERHGPRFSSRTLDIDLLLYDDLVLDRPGLVLPRGEIVRNAFVLCPLAEIAPAVAHPVLKRTFGELWEAFDKSRQPLWPISLSF